MPLAPIPLWSDLPDGPTIQPFPHGHDPLPAVLVCPGGGYHDLADHEGPRIAEFLNEHGFSAAVLRYRLAPQYMHPAMIHDAQRGIRLMRHHAADWGIKPESVGVMGFSAGGHLASSLAVHHDRFTNEQDELAQDISARPDAVVLCYPVIDMDQFAHQGSRDGLLGVKQNPKQSPKRGIDSVLVQTLSTYQHVSPQTPPVFLWHTAEDGGVPVENSLLFAMQCAKHDVPFDLHVYEKGRHGLGLVEGQDAHLQASQWPEQAVVFLHRHLTK